MLLCLVSCSDDDSSGPKKLKSTTTTIYYSNMENSGIETTTYKDNKPVFTGKTSLSGESVASTEYNYNSDGRLSGRTLYIGQSMEYKEILTYDGKGRIKEFKYTDYRFSENNDYLTTYSYNNDNTITKTLSYKLEWGNEVSLTDVYTMNEQGLIYMKENLSSTDILAFEGNNLINVLTSGNMTGTYIYDYAHPVKGEYLNIYKNQYGSYSNILLTGNFDKLAKAGDKYKISANSAPYGLVTYSYEFDAEGYPVKETAFMDEQVMYTTAIVYQ